MGEYYNLTPISFGFRVIELITYVYFMVVFLSEKINIKKVFIVGLIYALAYELFRILFPQYMTWILAMTIALVCISYFFKIKFLKAVIAHFITAVVVIIVDFVVSFSLLGIFKLESLEDIIQNEVLYYIGHIALNFIIFVIAKIIQKIRISRNTSDFKGVERNKLGLINIVCTFLVLMPNIVMILYYYDGKTLPLYMIIINICAIILMFFVSTYNTKKGFELVTAEQELITQRTYNKTLQNLVDSLRTFKHDYNNTLQTIYGYIQLDNMTELKKFFEQILDESRAITALDKLNPELFKNPSLFGIITAKYEYARQNNVNLDFEMYGELEAADMPIYELTRILGIFLDNAIEASTGSDKKKVNFMVIERKDKIVIEISNTYSEVGLKIEDINKKGISSKGENRGLGLYKVKEILKKYPTVKHETTAQNGMFRQKLVINRIKVKV